MGYDTTFEQREGVLWITLAGELNRDRCEEAARSASGHVTSDRPRILFDLRNTVLRENLVNLYDMVVDFDALGLPRTSRIAVLVVRDVADHLFTETVAVNRGLCVRYFNREADALRWLAGKPAGELRQAVRETR
jgi:hypothetical protein